MKERVSVYRGILVLMLFWSGVMFFYMKYNNEVEVSIPDVVRSDIFRVGDTYSESLIVVANTDKIIDRVVFVRKIIEMYIANSFRTIHFSIDENGYPRELSIDVYLWKEDIGLKEPVLKINYRPKSDKFDGTVEQGSEYYNLYLDGELIEIII